MGFGNQEFLLRLVFMSSILLKAEAGCGNLPWPWLTLDEAPWEWNQESLGFLLAVPS